MQTKIRLMLTRGADVDDAAIEQMLRVEAARLDAQFPDGLEHLRAFRLVDDRLREVANGSGYSGASFDAIMEIALEHPNDLDPVASTLGGFAGRLGAMIDPERSGVLVGDLHPILPGTAPLHIAIAARRLPHFTHDEYVKYWFEHHADEARQPDLEDAGLHYSQFHVDPLASRLVAQATGLAMDDFDGMSETYFTDAAALEAVYTVPGRKEHAYEDERHFVDHSRSALTLLLISGD